MTVTLVRETTQPYIDANAKGLNFFVDCRVVLIMMVKFLIAATAPQPMTIHPIPAYFSP